MEKNSNKQPIDSSLSPVQKKRATSYDVARVAGVSQSAVSRCFKPGASVSAKTRNKVESAAKKLGYQPNLIARGLITRRSNIVAVLITGLTNLNFPEVLFELNKALGDKGIHILLFTLRKESDVDEVLSQVWQYQVDGIIAAAQFTHEQINACNERGTPLVFFNRIYSESTINSVCCDHQEGERLLVESLINDNRRSFVVMSGPQDSSVSTARTKGAISKLNELPARVIQVEGDYGYEKACELIREILDADTFKPDAIVCANDTMAIGCIDTLRHEYDINVPDQIAVVGFDGVAAAHWASYELTTIVQPIERMVEAAVNMLLERIEDPELPAEKRLFAGKLLAGSSAVIA